MNRAVRRLLVTGFEPFGGETVNPSQRLVDDLRDRPPSLPGFEIHTAVLPVDIRSVRGALEDVLARVRPDVVLAVGQAASRDVVCLEHRAANRVTYGDRVDNAGHQAVDEPVDPDGPELLESSLPLADLAADLAADGHPVRVSNDAGRYLCNLVLYEVLWRHRATPAAFVHVPLLPEQAAQRGLGEPSLPPSVMERCLRSLLERLPRHLADGGP